MTASVAYAAVLFDWGDTLVAFPGLTTDPDGHVACLERYHAELDCPCVAAGRVTWPALREAYTTVADAQIAFSSATRREHHVSDRLAASLAMAGCECPLGPEEAEAHAAGMRAHLVAASRPVEGARAVLERLAGRVPLGVVSNHPDPLLVRDSLARAGLLDALDTVVVSGQIGWSKPDARPFRQALRELGAAPEATLFVGDTLATDVVGARALGLTTAWLAPPGAAEPGPSDTRPDHRLGALLDVLEVCDGARAAA